MKIQELNTKAKNTWCPDCTNNGILLATKQAIINSVNKKKIKPKNIVDVTGIGCHAKIYGYLNVNGFYSIHGRVLPTMLGIKVGNPNLTVIGFGGDGDTYAEGIAHFVHACRYNTDMTMIVHNNQVFALTTGQATPTTEIGFKDGSTPLGTKEKPLNPMALALASGATFVARGYAQDSVHLTTLIEQGILHKGFAFIDVLQPCITFHNTIPYFTKQIYKLNKNNHDPSNFEKAWIEAKEWDYCFKNNSKVPIGIFYKIKRPTFEAQWPQLKKPWYTIKRKIDWKKIVDGFR